MQNSKGKVVQVIGPVVDVEFPENQLPQLNNAILIEHTDDTHQIQLTCEVAQHLATMWFVVLPCLLPMDYNGVCRQLT